jgi:DNA topoisomerase-1
VLATAALRGFEKADSTARAKKNVLQAIEAVAGVLGNTPAVCRKAYIHPAIIECYMGGTLNEVRLARKIAGLRPDEVVTRAILQQLARGSTRKRKAA